MSEYTESDLVRVHIPDTTDPDHERFHRECGCIIDVIEKGMVTITGDTLNTTVYRVQFPNGEKLDLQQEAICEETSPVISV